MNYKKYKLTQYDELTKLFEENIDLNRMPRRSNEEMYSWSRN